MGMFDEVTMELYCPYCGKKLPNKSFQTKDLKSGMNRYTIIEALIENQKQGGGWIHLFFSCKDCEKHGYIEISDYDWKLTKEIENVLSEENNKMDIIKNKFGNE